MSSVRCARLIVVALAAVTLAACAQSPFGGNKSASLAPSRQASPESNRRASIATESRVAAVARRADASQGIASFYRHGAQTASGERFDARELTAAHRTLPFGTRLRVTNLKTGRAVTVRVTDRGPFIPGRVVDVSHAAAESLGMVGQGTARVKLDVVQ